MASNNEVSKYNLQGAQFGGGFAETVKGDQIGGVISNYSQHDSDIVHLLRNLRESAQTFPREQQEEALMELDYLEADLKSGQPNPQRLGKRLQRLVAAGTAAVSFAGGAAAFSGNLNAFTGNVLDLADKVGLSRDMVQPD